MPTAAQVVTKLINIMSQLQYNLFLFYGPTEPAHQQNNTYRFYNFRY